MEHHLSPRPIIDSIITIFCILIAVLPVCYCRRDEQYAACSRLYSCGSMVQDIGYPFWGSNRPQYCGRGKGFELKCQDNQLPIIEPGTDQKFRVLKIDSSERIMTLARDDLWDNVCPGIFNETTFDYSMFYYSPNSVGSLILFYDCVDEISPKHPNSISCSTGGIGRTGFYTNATAMLIGGGFPNLTETCNKSIKVPVQLSSVNYLWAGELGQALKQGFDVEYHPHPCSECEATGGVCGSNYSMTRENFVCFCHDGPQASTCPGNGTNLGLKLDIGLAGAALVILTVICFIIWCFRWKISSIISNSYLRKFTKEHQDLEAFIRNYGPLAPKRYSFSDVRRMTKSFKDNLGQGGYGNVFKGKLSNGRLVAVKLLNTSKGNGQEFINEVASISRTSHINVVTLLGFCLEGSKRALIYEFMSNGSLEKFIYDGDTSEVRHQLGWKKLYQIAIEIARGLEYLHRGCNTRILHLDIKPHNILLDEEFCPKISDFGLAKLCSRKGSSISMLEARGTIGYIAPEVFSRSFGEVSNKSDVYSYGMMILEMVGCRNHQINSGFDDTSEIYFPHWIYSHVEQGKEFKFPGVMDSSENTIAEKMIIVGLWCIQTRPSDRPSMDKVIEMLQGSLEALQIPPKPFLSSPPRLSSRESSTTWTKCTP